MKPLWITQWCVTVADSRFRIHRWLENYLKGAKLRSNYIWLHLSHLAWSAMAFISQRRRLWKPCLVRARFLRMNRGLGTEQRDTSLTRKSCAYARSSNLAQRIWLVGCDPSRVSAYGFWQLSHTASLVFWCNAHKQVKMAQPQSKHNTRNRTWRALD